VSDKNAASRPQERTARRDDPKPLAVYANTDIDARLFAIRPCLMCRTYGRVAALGCIESDGESDWHGIEGNRGAFADRVVLFNAYHVRDWWCVRRGRCIVTLAHHDREQRIAIQATTGYLRGMVRELKGAR
jgi:hypothetical protein